MMITRDTRFSAVKAFVHWWLLAMVGLMPATWLAEVMPTREMQALCYGAGLVWAVWSAWYIGHRDGYTKRVVPMSAAAMAAAMAADRTERIEYEAAKYDEDGYWLLYGDEGNT